MHTSDVGRLRQTALYLQGLAGRWPAVPVDPDALEAAARRRLSGRAFAYIAGGAGAERTMTANRAAFDRWRIVPRVLRDVGSAPSRRRSPRRDATRGRPRPPSGAAPRAGPCSTSSRPTRGPRSCGATCGGSAS